MHTSTQIAKHLREVFFGGNWTWSNVKDNLDGISWQQAVTKVNDFNTIAVLTYHIGYYVTAQLHVLQGRALDAKDETSFAHPPINSQEDWDAMVAQILTETEALPKLIEQLPDEKLGETFVAEKYGIYYRNLQGLIEHTHYHLGQIALIKKMVGKQTI